MSDSEIRGFKGNYAWASSFYQAQIHYQGHMFPDNEHAFQWEKAAGVNNAEWAARIKNAPTAGAARSLGRRCPKIRPDWDQVKKRIMFDLVWAKFTQQDHLRAVLLRTDGTDLIEDNGWGDTYWGVCDGVGLNYLGRTLMMVRDLLKVD
jgi:hypothetical protein